MSTSSVLYELSLSKRFAKGLKDIIKSGHTDIRGRVKEGLRALSEDPHTRRSGVDIKLISSRDESVYRLRIGSYRIIYEVDEVEMRIYVTKIIPRGKGYN